MVLGKDKKLFKDLQEENARLKQENMSLQKQNASLESINKSLEAEVDSLRDVSYSTVKIPKAKTPKKKK